MVELIFSKIGLGLAALVGAFLLWWRGSYHKSQAQEAKQKQEIAEAETKVVRKKLEVAREVQKMERKVDGLDANGIIAEFRTGGLRGNGDKS